MKATMLMILPFGTALMATGGIGLLVEVILLVMAARRYGALDRVQGQALSGDWSPFARLPRPSRLPELVGAAFPVAIVAITLASMERSRGLIRRSMSGPGTDPSEKAQLLSDGIGGGMNALMMGLSFTAIVGGLACVAVSLAVSNRLRARGLLYAAALSPNTPEVAAVWARHPGPPAAALVASTGVFALLGLGPIVRAIYEATSTQIAGYANLTQLDPTEKSAQLARALDQATGTFAAGARHGAIGVAVAAVIAGLVVVLVSPERARARLLGRPAPAPAAGATLVLAGVFAALAAGLFLLVRPLQRENAMPWPAPRPHQLLLRAATPDLTGPDELERAPVVTLADRLALDGASVGSAQELHDQLAILARNYGLLHPDAPMPGHLVLACAPEVPAARLRNVLALALRAGYSRPQLAFLKAEVMDRPILGRFERTFGSAAHATAVAARADAPAGAALVDLTTEQRPYGALAAEVVALRRQGKEVTLVVGAPEATP